MTWSTPASPAHPPGGADPDLLGDCSTVVPCNPRAYLFAASVRPRRAAPWPRREGAGDEEKHGTGGGGRCGGGGVRDGAVGDGGVAASAPSVVGVAPSAASEVGGGGEWRRHGRARLEPGPVAARAHAGHAAGHGPPHPQLRRPARRHLRRGGVGHGGTAVPVPRTGEARRPSRPGRRRGAPPPARAADPERPRPE